MKVAIMTVCALLLSGWSASAQYPYTSAVTNQAASGPQKPCDTTGNLPANLWSDVSSDTFGQPCTKIHTEGDTPVQTDPNDVCDQSTLWGFALHGHVTFGPPSQGAQATAVEVVTLEGGHQSPNDTCSGGNQITCNSGYLFEQDKVFDVGPYGTSIPFDSGGNNDAPYFSTPGDGNIIGFYVFAKPIGGSLKCTANQYVDEEHNEEKPTPTATPTP